MNVSEFVAKWRPVALTERSASQQHFLDLCEVFEHPKPALDDPTGERFTFERGAAKHGGGQGWADVWKKGFFGWEYAHRRLDEAVFAAYGWEPNLSDDEILTRLLELNQQRATAE